MRRISTELAKPASRFVFDALEPRRLMAVADPTATEQLFIELLNSARANPTQYAIDKGLSVSLSDATPQPPLAINRNIESAAQFKSNEMATYNYFGHQSAVTGKLANDIVRDSGYALPSNYISGQNYVESLASGYPTPLTALNALLEDIGTDPPGHRIHLLGTNTMYGRHNEIGVGYVNNPATTHKNFWTAMTAYTNTGSKFLTGVAYTDAVTTDNFYTPGEGLAGATITATPVGGGAAVSTTTLASGGYSLPLASGTYNVVASGTGFATPVTFSNVVVGSVNVKRDFKPSTTTPAAVVQSVAVNGGQAQRSRVTSLTVTFSQAVYLDAGAMTLVGRSGAGSGTTLSWSNSADRKVWTVTFGGTPVIGGSLADGVYDLVVVDSKVHAGSATGTTMTANHNAIVKRMFGDIDGDSGVSINDFNSFATSFGKLSGQSGYIAGFDFDNDGGISINDFNQLATRFGKTLPAATAPVLTAKRASLKYQR